jgi:hypothetical protein
LKSLSEVWAGRACAGANESELTTCGKNWGQEGGKGEAAIEKRGPRHSRRATVGRPPAPYAVSSSNFFNFLLSFFWTYKELPGILGEWVYNTPIFWSLPLHLEVLNLPFLMEIGDFTFFQILFLLNLEYTWTFISTVGIFVS